MNGRIEQDEVEAMAAGRRVIGHQDGCRLAAEVVVARKLYEATLQFLDGRGTHDSLDEALQTYARLR